MMTKIEVGKTYKNLNPNAGKTFIKYGKKITIPKQITVLEDQGPLIGLEIHSYKVEDESGGISTMDDDDAAHLELVQM